MRGCMAGKAKKKRARETRERYTRTGDRDLLVNTPDGFMDEPAIGQPVSGGASNPGFHWLGPDDWSLVNPTGTLAAATRAIELIAASIAGMPWTVRRSEVEAVAPPGWISDPQHRRLDARRGAGYTYWIDKPWRQTAVAFREELVASLLMRGNAYLWAPDGDPDTALCLINPLYIDVRENGYFRPDNGKPYPGRIIHIRGRAPFDDVGRGIGVLEAHAASIGLLSSAVAKATSAVTAPVPAGVLEVASGYAIDPAEATQLRKDWETLHSGRVGVGVLNSTTTFKPLSWSPEALQLVQLADFGIREVALAFGISPSWLGVPDSSLTYQTVQLKAIELRTFTLLPWVRRIESAFDSELPSGQELQILMDGLERADTESRYRAYETGIRAGFMTKGRARRLEGWPPEDVEAAIEAEVTDELQ